MNKQDTSTKTFRNQINHFKLINVLILLLLISGKLISAQNLEYEYAHSIGAAALAQDNAGDITTDLAGNVYTTGSYLGTFDFDPGPGTSNLSAAFFDVFISKLDASGNFVWARNFGGTNSDAPSAIFVDNAENVYITGTFYNSGDFDFGAGTTFLSSNGQQDVFIMKINAAGDFEWAKSIGGTGFDFGTDITVDQSGNVYVTGQYSSTVDFDPGSGVQNATANSSSNIYILKLDASGNFDWVNTYPGFFSFGGGQSIVTDSNGAIYTAGGFSSTVDFDPGAGTSNLTSNGGTDVFVSKLDASGNFIWAKNLGGSSSERIQSLDIDTSSNLYLAGKFSGTSDFDPGTGTSNLTSNGADDVFVAKLNANGDYLWAKNMGGIDDDKALALSIDVDGSAFTTGSFLGTADFDPGTGTSNLISAGSQDIFIAKLDANGNFVWSKSIGGNSSEYGKGISADVFGSLYVTGDFNDTIDFDPGTGVSDVISNGSTDVFVLKLSCLTTSGTATISACDSYVFNGNTYTTDNNTAKDTLTNVNGCDSIVTLDLTILNTTNGLDTRTACDSLTWINGITYTSSNFSTTFTITNAAGCDSIVQLDLTIINLDNSTSVAGGSITANATLVSYQWLDCSTNSPIMGETNPTFTPTEIGDYAVVVSDGTCADTSDCVSVTSVGINDRFLSNNLYPLYPNPSTNEVRISNFKSSIDNVSILDLTGKIIMTIKPTSELLDLSQLNTGIYIVKIHEGNEIMVQKLIKE
jgi:hypothetical protein